MTETSSPKVIPALTKTDARELKSLVRRDTEILLEELKHRRDEYHSQVTEERKRREDEIREQREARNVEDEKVLNSRMTGIQRRVKNLNEAIIEMVDELAEEGWRLAGYGRNGVLNSHEFTVGLPSNRFGNLLPPDRDDSDLQAQHEADEAELKAVTESVETRYRDAKRGVESREADMLRDLTLQSITTEAAQEFILEMPTADDLLPPPGVLEAIAAGSE